jgi:FSR family fosmidomycin resistance protein-like MFS transporter
VAGGIGVAAFHPQASSRATDGVEKNRGTWMAIFISAGTAGLAAGPLVFSFVATRAGLERTYLAALPGLLATTLLFFVLPGVTPRARRNGHIDWDALRAARKPLVILFLAVFIRSIIQITYMQLLPLYLHLERGFPVTQANLLLSGYLVAGAIGGLAGGRLADRIGGRRVIQASMIGCVPPLALFFLASGWVAHVGLLAGGLVLLFTIPVNVVMAQELVPSQTGTVSALMMGFAWGLAGLVFVPAVGWAGDVFSLHSALFVLLVFPLVGFLLARSLPR